MCFFVGCIPLSRLNNQLVTNESQTQQVILRIIAALLIAVLTIGLTLFGIHQLRLSEPYVRDVLALEGNPVHGRDMFLMNCAGCHGDQARGNVGPSLQRVSDRKSKIALIHQVVSGDTPPMPQFQPSPQEMADLLSYLSQL